MNPTPPPYQPNVVNQTVSYNGVTWKGEPGSSWRLESAGSGGASVPDPVATAQKLLNFQKTANEPIAQQLESTRSPLEQKYSDLVASIKQTGQVAADKQTLATNNELGRRGILNTSGLYEQEMAHASLPIQSAIAAQLAQTGMAEQGDLNELALQIAKLRAGSPSEALSGALNYGNQVQSANQFNQELALKQKDLEQQSLIRQAQASYYNAMASGKVGQQTNDPLGLFG